MNNNFRDNTHVLTCFPFSCCSSQLLLLAVDKLGANFKLKDKSAVELSFFVDPAAGLPPGTKPSRGMIVGSILKRRFTPWIKRRLFNAWRRYTAERVQQRDYLMQQMRRTFLAGHGQLLMNLFRWAAVAGAFFNCSLAW